MSSPFESWMGQPVILQIMAGDAPVPLRGTILSETPDTLCFQISEGWDVEVYKSMILAVEEDNPISISAPGPERWGRRGLSLESQQPHLSK